MSIGFFSDVLMYPGGAPARGDSIGDVRCRLEANVRAWEALAPDAGWAIGHQKAA